MCDGEFGVSRIIGPGVKRRHHKHPGELAAPARIAAVIVYLLLFAPLLIIIALSFNTDRYGSLPFHFTFHWYRVLASDSSLLHATWISVALSVAVAAFCVLIGVAASIWQASAGPGAPRGTLNGLLLAALTVPWLILGLGMLMVFNAVGIGRSMVAMFLGLSAISLPYVVFIVTARLKSISPSLAEAARSLGASPRTAWTKVTLPLAGPAIASAALMAFMVSFNNFLIQYFLAPFGQDTLPLRIYNLVKVGYTPDLNALATYIVVATIGIVAALNILGLRQALQMGEADGPE